jgi:hypothetical protein
MLEFLPGRSLARLLAALHTPAAGSLPSPMRHAIPTATQVGTESVRGCFCSTAQRYSQWELGDEEPA